MTTSSSSTDNTEAFGTTNNTTDQDLSNRIFTNIVETRRSVRRFDDTVIADEVLDDCLRLAMLAPNASNLQPWQFIVIESEPLRRQANKLCMGQNAAVTANKLIAIVARTDTWRHHAKRVLAEFPIQPVPKKVVDYYKKFIPFDMMQGVGHFLSPGKWLITQGIRKVKGAFKSPSYTSGDLRTGASIDAALAAENLMLALRAKGFDSCAMAGFDEVGMKKLLKLNDEAHIIMMIGAGKRADNGIYHAQFRFNYREFIKRV